MRRQDKCPRPAGGRFVKYWVHGAHLLVEGKKMSKSLGNFYTPRDLILQGFSGREIRGLLLSSHYRESFNFTIDGLHATRARLARLDECLAKLREVAGSATGATSADDARLVADFTTALDDDLNVAAAWGVVFEWVRETNSRLAAGEVTPALAAAALAAWQRLDTVFGLGQKEAAEAPAEIVALIEARQDARKAKNFPQADAIRDALKAKGWTVEDTPKGPKPKRILA